MKRVLEVVSQLLRYHKLKMLTVILSTIAFFALLFPVSDLTDLLTAKVMDGTNNQLLVQADKLNIGFFPGLSVGGDDISVDYGTLPTIEAKSMSFSPSVFSILSLAFGSPITSLHGTVEATGLLGGNLSVTYKPDGTADDGAKKSKIIIDADSIQLGEALKFTSSPLEMQGKASIKSDVDFFPGMDGQPEGEFQLQSKGIKLLAGTVPTDFGPFPIPGINWSQVHVKLRAGNSNLYMDDISLGTPKDPVSARAKGQMNLKIDKNGPILGAYEIKVELSVSSAAEKDLDTDLALLKGFRQSSPGGGKYVFRVTSNGGAAPPNLGPLSTF